MMASQVFSKIMIASTSGHHSFSIPQRCADKSSIKGTSSEGHQHYPSLSQGAQVRCQQDQELPNSLSDSIPSGAAVGHVHLSDPSLPRQAGIASTGPVSGPRSPQLLVDGSSQTAGSNEVLPGHHSLVTIPSSSFSTIPPSLDQTDRKKGPSPIDSPSCPQDKPGLVVSTWG